MEDKRQKEIFSKNLIKLIEKKGKTQTEVAKDLGIAITTLNNWCTCVSIPKVSKLQLLADYFGVGKSDLVDEPKKDVDFVLSTNEKIIIEWYRTASISEKNMLMRMIGKPESEQVRVIPVTVAAAPHSLKEIASRNADILLQNAVRMDRGDFNGKVHKAQRRSLRNKG